VLDDLIAAAAADPDPEVAAGGGAVSGPGNRADDVDSRAALLFETWGQAVRRARPSIAI